MTDTHTHRVRERENVTDRETDRQRRKTSCAFWIKGTFELKANYAEEMTEGPIC